MAKPNQKMTAKQGKTCTDTATAQAGKPQTEHWVVRGVTVERITADLEKARLLAHELGQAAAAVSACTALAKLHGLLIERSKVETTTTKDMPDEEIEGRQRQMEIDRVRTGGRDYLLSRIAECENLLVIFDAGEFEEWAAQGGSLARH